MMGGRDPRPPGTRRDALVAAARRYFQGKRAERLVEIAGMRELVLPVILTADPPSAS